jgi:hypothetical protein
MRCRGAVALLLMFTFFFGGISVYAIPISHENFSDADEDFFAILSFLTDSKYLCEQSLLSSYASNCTLFFKDEIEFSFNNHELNISIQKSMEIQSKLGYSIDVLNEIDGKAGSYEYLKEFLIPIKIFSDNVTFVTHNHQKLIISFQTISDNINSGEISNITVFSQLTEAHNALADCRKGVYSINLLLDDISSFFSTSLLENFTVDFNEILDRYELYLSLLIDFFPTKEPQLILIGEKTNVYLGDSISVSGFFIAESGFVSNHEIYLFFDNSFVNSTFTNNIGRYEKIILTNITDKPTVHNITAYTFYNGLGYFSDSILVTLHKIPTKLILNVSSNYFQPSASIFFSGQLCTYKNQGIQGSIILSYNKVNQSVSTNTRGYFNYTILNGLPFGRYSAFVLYNPQVVFDPCVSDAIMFNVNIPTELSISTKSRNLTIGENLHIFGRLQDGLTLKPIVGKPIQLYFNDHIVETALTNESGVYVFSWKTDNFSIGSIEVYTRYSSNDIELRDCVSEIVSVYVYGNNLAIFTSLIIFLFLALLILIVFISVLYKRRFYSIKTSEKGFDKSSLFSFLSKYQKKRTYLSEPRIFQNTEHIDFSVNLKQKIIIHYRLFLRYLSSLGLRFHESNTHLDIQKKLKKIGVVEEYVNSVTKIFENARYSQHQTKKDDVDLFDKNVFEIITNFRR